MCVHLTVTATQPPEQVRHPHLFNNIHPRAEWIDRSRYVPLRLEHLRKRPGEIRPPSPAAVKSTAITLGSSGRTHVTPIKLQILVSRPRKSQFRRYPSGSVTDSLNSRKHATSSLSPPAAAAASARADEGHDTTPRSSSSTITAVLCCSSPWINHPSHPDFRSMTPQQSCNQIRLYSSPDSNSECAATAPRAENRRP